MRAARAPRLRGLPRRLARCTAGVSALEFALVTPFVILLMLGVSDFVPSFVARFKAAHANGAFGDLVAQSSALRTVDVAAEYAAAADVMTPYASDTLSLRVTNVYSDGKGHAYVYWSCASGALDPLTARSAVTTTPTGVPVSSLIYLNGAPPGAPLGNGTNTSYVMAESSYTYTAPAQFVLTGTQTMKSVVFLYPRQSAYIGFPWNGDASTPPPKPTATSKKASLTLTNGAVCSYAK